MINEFIVAKANRRKELMDKDSNYCPDCVPVKNVFNFCIHIMVCDILEDFIEDGIDKNIDMSKLVLLAEEFVDNRGTLDYSVCVEEIEYVLENRKQEILKEEI